MVNTTITLFEVWKKHQLFRCVRFFVTKTLGMRNQINSSSHFDTYIQRYSYLQLFTVVQIAAFIQHSSNGQVHSSTQFRMVKSGPTWFSPLFLKGCISRCKSPNEMGVKFRVIRNDHSVRVTTSTITV